MIKQKKTYVRPEVTQIKLKGEEIFLSNCKLSSGTSATSSRSNARCTGSRCRTTYGTS